MSYARNLLSRGEEIVFESRQHWFAVVAVTWIAIIAAILSLAVLIWTSTSDSNTIMSILQVGSLAVLLGSLAFIGVKVWSWRNQEYLVTTRRVIKAEGIFNKWMGDSSLEKVNDAHLTQSWVGRIFDYGTLDILTAADEAETSALNDFLMLAEPVKFKIAMLNAKEQLENPELARAAYQRARPAPPLQRAEPMPPRAGSDRVHEVRDGMAGSMPASGSPAAPADRKGDAMGPSSPPPEPLSAPVSAAPPAPAGSAASSPSPADQLAATLESLAGLRDRGLITAEEYDAKKRELLERM